MGSITWVDASVWLVYFTLITLLMWVYRLSKSGSHYKYFIPGFLIKTFGAIVFGLIYIYYYKAGDTFLYERGARIMSETFLESPSDYFRLLFSSSGDLPFDLQEFSSRILYSNTLEEWFMVKLLSPLSFLSFHSYLVLTLFMSTIAFIGGWKLLLVFREIIPHKEKYAFWAVFLVPSVAFWGGGVMKDTVTLVCLNYLIYVLYFTLSKGEFKLPRIILSLVSVYLIFKLKSYILIAFLPTIIFFIYYLYQSKIKSSFIRSIFRPVALLVVFGVILVALTNVSELSQKYDVEQLEGSVKGFHSWHTSQGGSVYSLGDVEISPIGILSKIPAALNVTFFRPYFWEYSNPVILLSAAESFAVFILFILVIWYSGLRPLKYLKDQHLLKGLIFFILIFGFAVGFTAYNYGALARYKTPVMCNFVFILLYVYDRARHKHNVLIEDPK